MNLRGLLALFTPGRYGKGQDAADGLVPHVLLPAAVSAIRGLYMIG